MEYKIIHGRDEKKIEATINSLAKDGYELVFFHTATARLEDNWGNGACIYCHAIMLKR